MQTKRKPQRKPGWQQEVAAERVTLLFARAEKEFGKNPGHARRCIGLASKISMRYNVRLPASMKRKFCRRCHSLLLGSGSRRRISKGVVIVTCLNCGNVRRYPVGRRGK